MSDIIKHAGGRPTLYDPQITIQKIEEYLQTTGREQTELPSIEGLAIYLNVNPDTIYEWNKKHFEFSEYLKKLAAKQKKQLMDDGMYGGKEVNAAMAIFLLKAIHGMKDGSGISITGDKVIAILGGATKENDVPSNDGNEEVAQIN